MQKDSFWNAKGLLLKMRRISLEKLSKYLNKKGYNITVVIL